MIVGDRCIEENMVGRQGDLFVISSDDPRRHVGRGRFDVDDHLIKDARGGIVAQDVKAGERESNGGARVV